MTDINKLISKSIIKTFQVKSSAFLAPLLCNLEIKIDNSIDTAGTDGKNLFINEEFFRNISDDERIFVLLHEVWHVARLHMLRRNGRDPHLWNTACDIRINNDIRNSFNFSNVRWDIFIHDEQYDYDKIASEEEIYEKLLKENDKNSSKQNLISDDVKESDPDDQNSIKPSEIINKVVNAYQNAKLTNSTGSIPGTYEDFLDNFLKPVVPWTTLLNNYLTDLSEKDFSWKNPSRRFEDMYLPSLEDTEGTLEHIVFFLDTSGSISDEDVKRFNSEVKFIHDYFNPRKLTVIQFDTKIRHIQEYTDEDSYEKVKVIGRGGTSLDEVEEYIRKHKPTCSIIFSDMYCSPMNRVPYPIIFIVTDNPTWDSSFGKVIHIK